MKREDVRSAYQELTAKLSEIVRQLCFAALALVWIFKSDSNGHPEVPKGLLLPAGLIVVALVFDFLQYVYSSAAWGIYNRLQEKRGVPAQKDFTGPAAINWPSVTFLWLKVVFVAAGYVQILRFLRHVIRAA